MRFCCIADEETVRGFRLAGIAGRVVTSGPEAALALRQAVEQNDLAVIVLTQQVAATVLGQIEQIRSQRSWPLLVEIPGPQGALAGHKGLRQLVQEAVGIRLD